MEQLIPGLQPLALWMANSIELLHFIQHGVPQLLQWRAEQPAEGGRPVSPCRAAHLQSHNKPACVCFPSDLLDSEMSSTRAACEEAMTVLEEVIMFTFQQSVYYLTKVSSHTAWLQRDVLAERRKRAFLTCEAGRRPV